MSANESILDAIAHLFAVAVQEATTSEAFVTASKTAVTGQTVIACIRQHLGDKWVSLFLPPEAAVELRIKQQLKKLAAEASGRNRTKPDYMRQDLYGAWKSAKVNLHFFRGQRVRARYMNDTVIDEACDGWYIARVIGMGNSRGTLELLLQGWLGSTLGILRDGP